MLTLVAIPNKCDTISGRVQTNNPRGLYIDMVLDILFSFQAWPYSLDQAHLNATTRGCKRTSNFAFFLGMFGYSAILSRSLATLGLNDEADTDCFTFWMGTERTAMVEARRRNLISQF